MKKINYTILFIFVAVISVLHYVTPANLMFLHNLYSKLSYFPIVLGAVLFGLKGGLIFALLTTVGYTPHLILYKSFGGEIFISQFIEVLLYLAIGSIVGFIAGREKKLKMKYMKISEELEISYKRLHEETKLLIDIEETLRKNQRLSALGELSASVAHEIKNPLASIKGVTEIIADEFNDGHPKREFMDIMESEIERLDATVTSMLKNFSYKESYDTDGQKTFDEILESVLLLLKGKIKEKSIDFESNTEILKNIGFDGKRIYQILFNIILNGIDAVDDQGIIRIDTEIKEGMVKISIDDNGKGIGIDKIEKIFEPFYTGKKSGTGLGLSICRKIAESMKGRIIAEKSDLGGASFKIILPL